MLSSRFQVKQIGFHEIKVLQYMFCSTCFAVHRFPILRNNGRMNDEKLPKKLAYSRCLHFEHVTALTYMLMYTVLHTSDLKFIQALTKSWGSVLGLVKTINSMWNICLEGKLIKTINHKTQNK